ncbi:hypothetical protein GQX74_009237 [Glossina fuscipes]|nr:hypothetical protein GQX74_009237 [Glossina fuscipes]
MLICENHFLLANSYSKTPPYRPPQQTQITYPNDLPRSASLSICSYDVYPELYIDAERRFTTCRIDLTNKLVPYLPYLLIIIFESTSEYVCNQFKAKFENITKATDDQLFACKSTVCQQTSGQHLCSIKIEYSWQTSTPDI